MSVFKLLFTDHSGTGHKLAHNITTVLNIPLVFWLIYAVVSLKDASYEQFVSWITSPVQLSVTILFILTTLTHFVLELEVVMEDYISNLGVRKFAITALKTFSVLVGAATILSLVKLAI